MFTIGLVNFSSNHGEKTGDDLQNPSLKCPEIAG
jgi:hypothetical protein